MIHYVDGATSEDWRSRGAPLSGTDASAYQQARRALAAEAERLREVDEEEARREADACEAAAHTLARLVARRGVQIGPGGLR